MDVPKDLRFTEEHEWLRVTGNRARVGITAYASDQLGDIVYVELPKMGAALKALQPFGVVESVKAASDLFSPVSGTVVGVNAQLTDHPELVNTDPYGEGWVLELEIGSPAEVDALMDAVAYEKLLASEG